MTENANIFCFKISFDKFKTRIPDKLQLIEGEV